MAKYAITMWQTEKYEIVFDADDLDGAKAYMNRKTKVSQFADAEIVFVKRDEDIDLWSIKEITTTKEGNNA